MQINHKVNLLISNATLRYFKNALSPFLNRIPVLKSFLSYPFKKLPTKALSEEDKIFKTFVEKIFDHEFYLICNSDVKKAGLEPLEHWLNYGMTEGRAMSARAEYIHGSTDHTNGPDWQHFSWKGSPVAIRVNPLSQRVIAQILEQAEFDLGILAAGAETIESLPFYFATDSVARSHVDMSAIFKSLPFIPSIIIVTPFLCTGGAEKYAADLVQTFSQISSDPILVIVTEDTAQTCQGWQSLSILDPFKDQNILFWRDVCGPGYANPCILARFLHAIRPRIIVINNSRLGLDTTAGYGLGLSQYAKIFCTFFSVGLNGLGAPYGARYPHKILQYSAALTDNPRMADRLRDMWGDIPGPGIVELPAKTQLIDESTFRARMCFRLALNTDKNRHRQWLWVSRIEPFKGTKILSALARLRPSESFKIFGPLQGSFEDQDLNLPNILYGGVLGNIALADFRNHDGFVFTSLFEGMPNIALEMSQHAIPLILADVGGLRGTFDDTAAKFVMHKDTITDTAIAFSGALDNVCRMQGADIERMVIAARDQVSARHSAQAYKKNVRKIFDL